MTLGEVQNVPGILGVLETVWRNAKANVRAHRGEYHSSLIHMSNRFALLIKAPAEKPVECAWVREDYFFMTHEISQDPTDTAVFQEPAHRIFFKEKVLYKTIKGVHLAFHIS